MLESEDDWRVGEVNPSAVRNLAMHCLNRHQYYKRPNKGKIQKPSRFLGKYQLEFFHLWEYSQELSLDVSTQKLKERQAICVTYPY